MSCQSENTCEAYGSYDSSGVDEPMVVQITDGVPATEVEVIPPAGSLSGQNVELQGISCSSSSACVAVGSYETTGYADRPRGPDLGRGAGAVRGAFFAR